MPLYASGLRVNAGKWSSPIAIGTIDYECAFCGNQVGTNLGYKTDGNQPSLIALCPRCQHPTFFTERNGGRIPGPTPGEPVMNYPQDLSALYSEARVAAGAGAYTAAVMVCRKMLMNIAV